MRCNSRWSTLCLILAAAATTGCASMPGLSSLMPGKAAKTPQNLEAQVSLGRLSERQGDLRTAEQIYQAIVAKQPQNQLALHRLGVLAAKANEPEKAAQYFQAASQAGPPSAELLNDIGFNLFAMGRREEAEAAYRQALELDARNQAARNNLGLLLGETRRYDESLAEFRRAGQDEAAALANLAYAQTQAGDVTAAKVSYHRALTLNSELKPAAEALVQLTRQPLPPGLAGAPGRDAASAAPEIKSLPELVREGKTADFIESVIERRRGDGRTATAARSRKFEGAVQPAAYFPRPDAASTPDASLGSMQRVGQSGINAAAKRSTGATDYAPGGTSPGTRFAVDPGAQRVLTSVFRFPAETESASVAEIHRRTFANELSPAAAARPTMRISEQIPDRGYLTEMHAPSGGRREPLHQPPPNQSPDATFATPAPPAGQATAFPAAAVQATPSGIPAAAPALFPSSAPAACTPSPWQTPTWMPDLGADLSAGSSPPTSPAGDSPEAMPIPAGPLATMRL